MKLSRQARLTIALAGLAPVGAAQCELEARHVSGSADFGRSIALAGDVWAIGHPDTNVSAYGLAGKVSIFRRIGSGWGPTPEQEVAAGAADLSATLHFGASVAVTPDGQLIFVGAPRESVLDGSQAVYVFKKGTPQWLLIDTIRPNDPQNRARFGAALSVFGDSLLVGAPNADGGAGAGYVFQLEYDPVTQTSSWVQKAKLKDVAGHRALGTSVSLWGDDALLGAPAPGSLLDRALIFEKPQGGWVDMSSATVDLVATFQEPASFGASVAIRGDVALVGVPDDRNDQVQPHGSVRIFHRNPTWQEAGFKLVSHDSAPFDRFGISVDLSDERIVVGAAEDDDLGSNSGSVYVFEYELSPLQGVSAFEVRKLLASDGGTSARFGSSVLVEGEMVGVGAPDAGSGAAYLFGCLSPAVFCADDGTGTFACPCGNTAGLGEGCLHTGGRGMGISAHGSRSISADELAIRISGAPVGNTGALVVGTGQVNADPSTSPFDGLLCVGGSSMHRYWGVRQLDGNVAMRNVLRMGVQSVDPPVGFFMPGTYYFQYYSRDNQTFPSPCNTGVNLSPAIEVTLVP